MLRMCCVYKRALLARSIAGDRIEHDRPLIQVQYNVLESGSPHGSDECHWGPKQRQLQAVCHPRVGEQRRLFHCSLCARSMQVKSHSIREYLPALHCCGDVVSLFHI